PRLTGGDERVQPGEALTRGDVADEEVVLPPERHTPERTLGGVVVEGDADVVEEDAELLPLPLSQRSCRLFGLRRGQVGQLGGGLEEDREQAVRREVQGTRRVTHGGGRPGVRQRAQRRAGGCRNRRCRAGCERRVTSPS